MTLLNRLRGRLWRWVHVGRSTAVAPPGTTCELFTSADFQLHRQIDRHTRSPCADKRHCEMLISINGVSSGSFSSPQHLISSACAAFGDMVFLAQLAIKSCCLLPCDLFFRGPLCCTGRRRAEKNERKVGKEARREKWTTAHLGVRWRQSGRQRKKERRGKEGEWQGKGHRETKRDAESRQIRREIRAGSMTERVEDQKGCFHLYFYLIQKCAHIKKCQLRERTAQTVRKAVLTAQPT